MMDFGAKSPMWRRVVWCKQGQWQQMRWRDPRQELWSWARMSKMAGRVSRLEGKKAKIRTNSELDT
jgi:hypothetical protein